MIAGLPLSLALFRLIIVCGALFFGSNAFALILAVDLNFKQESLALNGTGTFTISGETKVGSNSSARIWSVSSNGAPGDTVGLFSLQVLTASLVGSNVTLGGKAFNLNMLNTELLILGNDQNIFGVGGSAGLISKGLLFKVGNGTTDFISGTFKINASTDIGSLRIEDLNMTVKGVQITATPVPEPATFSALAGVGVLGLACMRRRRVRAGV